MNYKIHRIINNNSVVAFNGKNEEIILLGCGIGFQKKPGDRIQSKKIEKTFIPLIDDNYRYIEELIKSIPFNYFEVVNEIIHLASSELKYDFEDSLFLTLLDHISFAIARYKNKEKIENPLLFEIQKFYPKEYSVAQKCVDIINLKIGVMLDSNEAGYIAFHFVNAMSDVGIGTNKTIMKILDELLQIVQEYYGIKLNTDSSYYARFITHLKYFLVRVFNNNNPENKEKGDDYVYEVTKEKYKSEYECALKIADYLKNNYSITVLNEEIGYLIIHIKVMINAK
jgi:beta-glucoside operon transcriptional antiterminator